MIINPLKALSSTEFKHSKESQVALYRRFVRPILECACAAWTPDLAQTHMENGDAAAEAERCITHCHWLRKVDSHGPSSCWDKGPSTKTPCEQKGRAVFCCRLSTGSPVTHNSPDCRYRGKCTQLLHTSGLCLLKSPLSHLEGRSPLGFMSTSSPRLFPTLPPTLSSLGEVPPPIASDALSLPRRCRVDLARLRCGHHLSLRWPKLPVVRVYPRDSFSYFPGMSNCRGRPRHSGDHGLSGATWLVAII